MSNVHEMMFPFNGDFIRVKFVVHEGDNIEIVRIYGLNTVHDDDKNGLLVGLYTSGLLQKHAKQNEKLPDTK